MGPSGQIVTYPLRQGTLLNIAATVKRSDWLNESWSEAGTVEEFRSDFADWHEDVLAIIEAIEVPYKWALIGRPPLQHCSAGRVTLLGDAFHPTLPILGQGANMAIEDSMILARCLEISADTTEALQRYEVARLERTSQHRAWLLRAYCTGSAMSLLIQIRRRHSWTVSSRPRRARPTIGFTGTMR